MVGRSSARPSVPRACSRGRARDSRPCDRRGRASSRRCCATTSVRACRSGSVIASAWARSRSADAWMAAASISPRALGLRSSRASLAAARSRTATGASASAATSRNAATASFGAAGPGAGAGRGRRGLRPRRSRRAPSTPEGTPRPDSSAPCRARRRAVRHLRVDRLPGLRRRERSSGSAVAPGSASSLAGARQAARRPGRSPGRAGRGRRRAAFGRRA